MTSTSIGHITVIKKNGKDGPRFVLEPSKRTTYTIGSGLTNHIHMARPDVCEEHAQLTIDENNTLHIAHIALTHSTFLNDQPLLPRTPSQLPIPHALHHLDVFRIADRCFRVEYAPVTSLQPPSTPTKSATRDGHPLAVIGASPSSVTPASSTPKKRGPSMEKRDSNGNTGSTASDKPHGHTSTPTPNRRKSVTQRLSTSPAGVKKASKSSMSPQEKTATGRKSGGDSTPKSNKAKKRSTTPTTPTSSPSVSKTPGASPLPPAPPAEPAPPASPVKPVPEAGEPGRAEERRPSSPQTISDISAAGGVDGLLDDLAVFELPMCSGPLSTLTEDPEEEEDPPAPPTRRFLPTPVRREVEVKARVIAERAREKLEISSVLDCTVVHHGQTGDDGEEARVSVCDGDVCHVDEEIVLSPGTLHRRALQSRHIRYGAVIQELKAKHASKRRISTPVKPDQVAVEKPHVEAEEPMELVSVEMPAVLSLSVDTDQQHSGEDMEMEEVAAVTAAETPASPVSASPAEVPALPTPVRRAIRERPLRTAPSLSVAPTLPTPVKKSIRAGRALKPVQAEQQQKKKDPVTTAEEEENHGSAFLPVAEIFAHEPNPAARHSLPAQTANRRKNNRARTSAAPALSSTASDEVKEEQAPEQAAISLPITHQNVSLGRFSSAPADGDHRASGGEALRDMDVDGQSPASPPLKARIPLDEAPSTPSSPSKATGDRLSLRLTVEADHPIVPKPLPALPTPVRRSIRERGQAREAALLQMPTPLKRDVAVQEDEGVQQETGSTALPQFNNEPVSSRRSLPASRSVMQEGRRTGRRATAAAKLAAPEADVQSQEAEEPMDASEQSEPIVTAPRIVGIPERAALPISRQSLPLTSGAARGRSRQQRRTAHAALSSMAEDSSPCSPPPTATISLDEVPPTPASPHKSAAKRLSHCVDQAPPASHQATEDAAAPLFVSRAVDSRQSLPAQRQKRSPTARQSMAARVQYVDAEPRPLAHSEPEATVAESVPMDISEAETESAEADHAEGARSMPAVEFESRVPAVRHSLPLQAGVADRSGRRRTAAAAASYTDMVVSAPSLPSPIRRSIEERSPREVHPVLHPLLSPVKRGIQRGVTLRPVPASLTAAPAEPPQAESTEPGVTYEEQETAASTERVLMQEEAEEKPTTKTRGRKRKADVAASDNVHSGPPAEPITSTRSKRSRTATAVGVSADSSLPGQPATSAVAKAAAGRTRKAKKVTIVEPDMTAEESVVQEETPVPVPVSRTRKGRAKAAETAAAPESPEPSAPTRTRRGRQLQAQIHQATEPAVEEMTDAMEDAKPARRSRARARAAPTAAVAESVAIEPERSEARPSRRTRRAVVEPSPVAPLATEEASVRSRTRKGRKQPHIALEEEAAPTAVAERQPRPSRTRKGKQQRQPETAPPVIEVAEMQTDAVQPTHAAPRGRTRRGRAVEAEAAVAAPAPRARGRRNAAPPEPLPAAADEIEEAAPSKRTRRKAAEPLPSAEEPVRPARMTRSRARS